MINGNYIWQLDPIQEIEVNYDKLHPIILQLLKKRGIVTSEQIHRYIHPKLDYLYNPMLLKDMDKALIRIREALSGHQKITVYGDYDVDGITSCSILVKLLKNLGGIVDYYIPSRLNEGYGLNKEAIEMIHKQGTNLIITVDNGIGSYEEVEYASAIGLDVIITDHHEPQQKIPQAVAVINPKQKNCNYPFKELAGVGVALKLAHALMDTDSKLEKELLELAAIGTVADIVPLLGENRIIVKNGLEGLGNTENKGLMAMMTLLNFSDITIEPGKVSYLLAPRINATGRIADPGIAVELLLCEDETRAFELAATLEKINQERQVLEAKVLDDAKAVVKRDINLDLENIIVVSSPNWHPGVIGTVASKLAETYGRPCIMIAEEGEEARGSGRSISGFNLFKAISELSHLLIRYGGHEQAAGLSIKSENIQVFRRELNRLFKEDVKQGDLSPKLDIDLELNQRDINLKLAEQIELMKPFGYGNPRPVFMCRNLYIENSRTVGNGDKHLKLNLKSSENTIDAIGFNFGIYKEDLDLASIMDAAFYLEVNRWRGFIGPQLNIKDLKVPFLQDDLLFDVEKNYYLHFCSNLGKKENKIILENKSIDQSNIIFLRRKSILRKMKYLKALFAAERKVIIVINTPYKAWQLLTYLKEEKDLLNKIEVFYTMDSAKKNQSDNIIMIDPFPVINHENFDDIVFYDMPFSVDILKKRLSGIPSTSKLHILFEREDLHYNYLVCQQMLPSINELKIVYQTLAKHTTGSFICSLNINEFRDILIEQSKIDIHHSGLINIFRIFQELDIIKFNIKNGFINISDYKKHDSKLRLEFSDTYMHLYLLKKDVIKFYNQFNTLTAKLFKGYGGN